MPQREFEVVILGTGPAGLQAAIHAARSKVSVLLLGRDTKSSLHGAHVENFCCLEMMDGSSMLEAGRAQAVKFGAEFLAEDVVEMSLDGDWVKIKLESGREITARTVIMAMGVQRKKLKVPGEKELFGKGVSYCVDCDAGFYRGKKVALVGNESAAATGALTMLFYADEVHLVTKGLAVADLLVDQIRQSAVEVHEGRWPTEIVGENEVQGLVLDDGTRIDVDGVFIELGAKGAIELAATLGVALDPESFQYIVTDKKQATNVKGIYAAGDICGPPWQVAKAVGEGCVAGIEAAHYAKKLR